MRPKITREMLQYALERGWSASHTARHLNMHPSSVGAACVRFGISLPMSIHSPQRVSPRRTDFPAPSTERVKAWSANPAAIHRALARIEREKRLK